MKYYVHIMSSMTFTVVLLAEIKDTISEISHLLPPKKFPNKRQSKTWGEEEGEQGAAVAKLMEATGSQALTASTQLLGTGIAKHTG